MFIQEVEYIITNDNSIVTIITTLGLPLSYIEMASLSCTVWEWRCREY